MGKIDLFENLLLKLGNRRVVPPTPAGAKPAVSESDDAEIVEAPAGEGIPLALYIEYRDAKGQVSHRRIACKRYEPDNHTLLAFCFERRGFRRFRLDRIAACVCSRTGEVYAISDIVAGLDGGALPTRDERLARLMTILVFLMQCDREEHDLEREVIEEAAASFALRFDGNDATVAEGLRLARRIAPDSEDFVASLRWISRQPERALLARLIDQFSSRLVIADGRIASEEAYFSGLLADALKHILA